jgi:hypothetical protein
MRLPLRLLPALALMAACGGSDGPSAPPPVLTTITVSLSATTVQVGQTVAATAAGQDQNGAPIATGPITWSSDATTVATVGTDGTVATVAPGRVTIAATAGGRTGQATLEVTPGPPASLARTTTDSLLGTVGTALATSPSVVVRDARGFAVPNVTVTFAVTTGGGTLATPSAVTNAQGIATTGTWTLGTTVGTNVLTATVPSVPVLTISATANAGPAAAIAANSPTTLAGTVGKAVSSGVQVVVRDAFGNTVPGATVTFTPATGSGTVTAASAPTNAQGVAAAGTWTLGTATGTHTLSAKVGALAPVTFSASAAPDAPAALAATVGTNQTATVAAPVPVPPAVRVTDQYGNTVPSVSVSFSVTGGGGFVTGSTRTTDSTGTAAVGVWTLGTRAGANTLRASVQGVTPLTFSATGTAAAPWLYGFIAGSGQIEVVGTTTPTVPAVRVVDRYANPVSGVPVTFAVTQGGGGVESASTTTNADGVVTPGSWRLGTTTGFNVLQAMAPGFDPITLRARGVPASQFPIEVRYVPGGMPSPALQAVINAAVARVRKLFVYSVPTLTVSRAAGSCGATSPAVNEVISGVMILADVRPVDGLGGNLGSAGWCTRRLSPLVTALGMMTLDADDLANNLEQAYETVIHEILHVMGFGGFWDSQGLVWGSLTTDPWFNGLWTRAAFNAMGGASYMGNKVPIENIGGAGTRLAHWRSSVMYNEMMTGYACRPGASLSYITVSSFTDMNISVALYGDDDFTFTGSPCAAMVGPRAQEVPFEAQQEVIDPRTGRVVGAAEVRAALGARLVLPPVPRVVPEQVLQRTRRE